MGPVPPDLLVPPSLAFVYEYWQRMRPKRIPSFPDSCVLPGEWVLAVGHCRGLKEAIEQEFKAKCAEKMAEIARGWEQHELVCAWMRKLMDCRVPGDIVSVEYGMHPLLDPLYCPVLHCSLLCAVDRARPRWECCPQGDGGLPCVLLVRQLKRLQESALVVLAAGTPAREVRAELVSGDCPGPCRVPVEPGEGNLNGHLACTERGGEYDVLFVGENNLCLRRIVRRARKQCGLA